MGILGNTIKAKETKTALLICKRHKTGGAYHQRNSQGKRLQIMIHTETEIQSVRTGTGDGVDALGKRSLPWKICRENRRKQVQEKKRLTYEKGIFVLGTLTIVFVGTVVLLASLFLIIGVSIQAFEFYAAIFISLVVTSYLFQLSAKQTIRIVVVWMGILIAGLILSGAVYDFAWDGNAYHKAAVGALRYGWNPIRESIASFIQHLNIEGFEKFNNIPWVENFPKASWYFGACIYAVTGKIETAKVINLLLLFCTWTFSYHAMSGYWKERNAEKGNKTFFCIVFATFCAAHPIAINQMFTFYVDGLLASCLTILLLCLFCMSSTAFWKECKCLTASLFCVILLACNLKFTALGMVAVFCAAFYIVWVVRAFLKERSTEKQSFKSDILKLTGFYVVAVCCAVFLVGAGSYLKNYIAGGHPFYPIMGKQATISEDTMMAGYLPDEVEPLGNFSKWTLVFLSRTQGGRGDIPIQLKIPFTFHKSELIVNAIDTERAGFGFWFSGLFIVGMVISIAGAIQLGKNGEGLKAIEISVCLACCVLLVGIVSASWLARYSPYLYLPVQIAGGLLFFYRGKTLKGVCLVFISLALINCATLARYPLLEIKWSGSLHQTFASMREEGTVQIVNSTFPGVLFDLQDEDVCYEIVESLDHEEGRISQWGMVYGTK